MSKLQARFDGNFPGSYFRSRELNNAPEGSFDSVDGVWEALLAEQNRGNLGDGPKGIIRQLTSSNELFFRGQSNQAYGLSSSLHRLLARETDKEISEALLGKMEESILDDARSGGLRGLNDTVSPGQLLMILQHHAAPTRLIDVSLKPLEALYFAVETGDNHDGRLFMMTLNPQEGATARMKFGGQSELPWQQHVRGGSMAASEWTQSVYLVDEEPLDPRMVAQRGRFLVGGVQRAYANLNQWFEDKQLRVVERQKISMLCMTFPKRDQAAASKKWPSLGWTLRIPAAWKPELRRRLGTVGIDHESTYPDMASVAWRAELAVRTSLARS